MKNEGGRINEEAFHSNDIRGIYPTEVNEALAYHLGGAFASQVKEKEIFVGRDDRVSSPSLAKALNEGILDAGKNVIYLGIVDTPQVYFATGKYNKPGLIITASHNPSEYNGIIVVNPGAQLVAFERLKKLAGAGWKKAKKRGKIIEKDVFDGYLKFIFNHIKSRKLKKMRIVVDAGNGVAGEFVNDIFSKTPAEIIPLFFEPQGEFPNHVPNPEIYANLADLQRAVIKHKADFGIAFDGDADRAAFVDEKGDVIAPSCTASLIAQRLLQQTKRKNERIIYTALSSRVLPETIKSAGGKGIPEKIGHAFLNAKMRKEKALFGAEEPGHYYYKSNFYADSAFITALIFYEIVSESKNKASNVIAPFRKYYKPGEINVRTDDKTSLTATLNTWCAARNPLKTEEFDGKTFFFTNYWINIRASMNEPLVRITLEADEESSGKKVEQDLRTFIKASGF